MIQIEREKLEKVLEALELGLDYAKSEQFENSQRYKGYEHLAPDDAHCVGVLEEAITAIKEALAQPEQKMTYQQAAQLINEMKSQPEEHNFCPRCGKRNKDIHTCTPPQD